MDGIAIRTAETADLDDVVDLLAAQLREHDIPTPRDALTRAVRGSIDDAGGRGRILVARATGPAAGAGAAAPGVAGGSTRGGAGHAVAVAALSYQWTLEHGGRSAWLEELYVVPALRERGIGLVLLRAALAAARADGATAVDLEVAAGHERVESLYRREGFEALPRRRWVRAFR